MALDDLLGGAVGVVWSAGLACPNPQHLGMLQQQAAQANMDAYAAQYPYWSAEYDAAVGAQNAYVPPPEHLAEVIAYDAMIDADKATRGRDWLYWGWLLAGALALAVRWGLTH